MRQGSGALKLGGNNSWTGGTQREAGTLEALSAAAFGKGDVYLSGSGTLVSNAPASLAVGGKYTQLAGITLELRVSAAEQGRITVAGDTTIGGGRLRVKFLDGYKPVVGAMLTVISAGSLEGEFQTISVDGYTATPVYGDKSLQLCLGN